MKKYSIIVAAIFSASVAKAEVIDYKFDYNLDGKFESECRDLEDPFEPVNRKIFYANSFLDYIILKPIAKGYGKVTNQYTRDRVGNLVDNVYEPLSTVNYGLQGNLGKSLESFWRFAVNSVFGVAGTFDVAAQNGLKKEQQTFGSTLAHYGVSPGPYVVLPLMGSTNMRDMWDLIAFDNALNPTKYHMRTRVKNVYSGISVVHKRHDIMPYTDYISKNSTDPYSAIRSALHQRRESTLHYPEGYKCGVRPSRLDGK